MERKLMKVLALVVVLCVLFSACGTTPTTTSSSAGESAGEQTTQSAPATETKDKITVGATLADFTISFQAAMYKAILDSQNTYPNMTFIMQDGASDSNKQINQLETFIAQGVDAIIINAVTDAVEPTLKSAIEQDIPVFAINRSISDENAYSYFIGADDYKSGVQMAGVLTKMVEEFSMEHCNIIYIQGVIGATYQKLRQGGFDDTMTSSGLYDSVVNVMERIPCKHDKETVISAIQNMLNKYPAGQIDAIVCEGPDDAIGALQAVKAAGRTELVGRIVGMDMPTEVWNAVKNGELYGTVLQDPAEQCKVGIETINTYFFGDKASLIDKFIETDLPMVTKENVNDVTPSW